jgi:hypothetical protein
MRIFMIGLTVFALGLGAAALIASPRAGARATVDGTITGAVEDGPATASLLNLSVTSVAPGTYEFDISDNSDVHNFDICPGAARCTSATSLDKTQVVGTGSVVWIISLANGTYTYQCDAHGSMTKHFTVTDGSTTTSTTTTPALTLKIVATKASRKVVTVKVKTNNASHITASLLDKNSTDLADATPVDGTAGTLKLVPAAKLAKGKYSVSVTADDGTTQVTKKKKVVVM